jgi:putative zinc finger protein
MEQHGVIWEGNKAMVVNCETVWREISNYLDGEVDPTLRAAVEEHVRRCKRCTVVLEGTRNVVQLYGDERMLEVPLGFGHRLHRRLDDNMRPTRRGFFGWMVAAAAAVLVAGSFEVAGSGSSRRSGLRSAHAQPGRYVPPDMMVLVYPDGKTFHAAGCPYILDKANLKTITAREAQQEGYVPCVRCMKKYLSESAMLGSASLQAQT